MAKPDIPSARWVGHPRSFTPGREAGQPTVIIIHTTEGSEGRQSAENGAAYDKVRTDGTSAHLYVDQDSIVQEVEFKDTAHTARRNGNRVGIQIEVCGKAGQTVAQWADEASTGTIAQLVRACYEIRRLYGRSRFPLVELTPAQLGAGQRGFAEHRDASLGFPQDRGDHTDPGPNFPWGRLFAGIKALEEDEDDMATPEQNVAEFVEQLKDPTSPLFAHMRAIMWKYPTDTDATPRSALRVFQDVDQNVTDIETLVRTIQVENTELKGQLDRIEQLLKTLSPPSA